MKRMQLRLLSISRLYLCLLIALCVSAPTCNATVEPELTTAIRHKNIQHVQTLLSEGVNVNERDGGNEQTPLMWAVQVGDVSIVQTLLHHGSNVNAIDDSGNTALTLAVQRGYRGIARVLVRQGAKRTDISTGTKSALAVSPQIRGTVPIMAK
jgi:ankyrin repeat protein